jgi:Na+/proline symporter
MMTVFFFAHLWRRAGVITDVEFIELRYEGKPAAVLRGFMAVYGGILQNCITMGWVMLAMMKICDVMLGWDRWTSMAAMMALLVFYTTLSGYWGVVWTDFFQFGMAMFGCIALAVIVVYKMGGIESFVDQVQHAPGFSPKILNFVPDFKTATQLVLLTFAVQMSIQWWGAGQGGGYIAQRLFSTSNEKEAALSALWFNFAHYVLRPWPWIIVGLASLVYFPDLSAADAEKAYPLMIREFLPVGLRGLMVASLMAAFMSTMETQLNWGASYLINDLYKRFLVRDASAKHYVTASRVSVLLLTALGALTAWQSETITGAWIYLTTLTAGAGMVGLLRWYWWRVNPWSEISALAGSFIIANGNIWVMPFRMLGVFPEDWGKSIDWLYSSDAYAVRTIVIVGFCTVLWVAVTFLTSPVPDQHLERFFRRVRPGGWWGHIASACPDVARDRARYGCIGWLAGVISIYAGLFGIGYLCLARPVPGLIYLAVAAISGWYMVAKAAAIGRRT